MIMPWNGFKDVKKKCERCGTEESEDWYFLECELLCEDCKEEWFDKKIKNHYRYLKSLDGYDIRKDNKFIDRLVGKIENGRIEE